MVSNTNINNSCTFMTITEQNWKEELRKIPNYAKGIANDDEIEPFIQSLITSIKQEERDKLKKKIKNFSKIVNKYYLSKDYIDHDNIMLYGIIEESQIFIQSLTEEDDLLKNFTMFETYESVNIKPCKYIMEKEEGK